MDGTSLKAADYLAIALSADTRDHAWPAWLALARQLSHLDRTKRGDWLRDTLVDVGHGPRPAIPTIFATALAISAIKNASWSDVDWAGGFLVLVHALPENVASVMLRVVDMCISMVDGALAVLGERTDPDSTIHFIELAVANLAARVHLSAAKPSPELCTLLWSVLLRNASYCFGDGRVLALFQHLLYANAYPPYEAGEDTTWRRAWQFVHAILLMRQVPVVTGSDPTVATDMRSRAAWALAYQVHTHPPPCLVPCACYPALRPRLIST